MIPSQRPNLRYFWLPQPILQKFTEEAGRVLISVFHILGEAVVKWSMCTAR